MSLRETQEVQNVLQTTSVPNLDSAYSRENAALLRSLTRSDGNSALPRIHVYTGDTSPPLSHIDPRAELETKPTHKTRIEDERRGSEENHGANEADKRVAATLSKYFDQIDQSHWYAFGKDEELTKSEILEFLASDAGRSLNENEKVDLLSAANQFDRIQGLHTFGVFCLDRGSGITQADISYLDEGTSTFEIENGELLRSLEEYLKNHPIGGWEDLIRMR